MCWGASNVASSAYLLSKFFGDDILIFERSWYTASAQCPWTILLQIVNVKDTIFWLSPTIESCNWIDFISVAYASWYPWKCGPTQRKAATINQLACPRYSRYVQLLWYPLYYAGVMKAWVSPVQWSKPHSILAPSQDSNPGCRIQNHKRWPLHYHWQNSCKYTNQHETLIEHETLIRRVVVQLFRWILWVLLTFPDGL